MLTNLIVTVVVFMVAIPPTTWAAWLVPDKLPVELVDEESSAEEVEVNSSIKAE